MKLPARARQAVCLMMELHRQGGEEEAVSLRMVAASTGWSAKLLEQLVIGLKARGLLVGVCGRRGGYLLARPAEEITVGEVLRSVVGPIDLAFRGKEEAVLPGDVRCDSNLLWLLLRKRIDEVLDACTVADLSDEVWAREVRGLLSGPLVSTSPRPADQAGPWGGPVVEREG